MRATITVNASAPTPATLTGIGMVGALEVNIASTGGNPPCRLQKKATLEDGAGTDVATTDDPAIIVPRETDMAFYRVAGPANQTVTPLTIWMSAAAERPNPVESASILWEAGPSGDAERPNPVTTTASGYGDFWLVGNEFTYDVGHADLTSVATAAHLHGPADHETAAGVLQPLVPRGALGTSGAFSGTLTLTLDQLAAVGDERSYVSVHTATNPGGEVRGQVASSQHE